MAESTLSLTLDDLRNDVGFFLNFGPSYASYTDAQKAVVTKVIKIGQRQFLFPPRLPNARKSHEWTFLRPVATLTTVAATATYELPDNFGGIEGVFTYDSNSDGWCSVPIVPEQKIRQMKMNDGDATGQPQLACLRPKTTDGSDGQRWEVEFWPTPGAAYDLDYRYNILPDALANGASYPYGGAQHAETVRASCLAAAESEVHDVRGEKWERFMERLAASIDHDTHANTPEFLGTNRDRSDGPDEHYRVPRTHQRATYRGIDWA